MRGWWANWQQGCQLRNPKFSRKKRGGRCFSFKQTNSSFGKTPVVFHTSTPLQQSHPSEVHSSSSPHYKGCLKKCVQHLRPSMSQPVEWVKEKSLWFRCLNGPPTSSAMLGAVISDTILYCTEYLEFIPRILRLLQTQFKQQKKCLMVEQWPLKSRCDH